MSNGAKLVLSSPFMYQLFRLKFMSSALQDAFTTPLSILVLALLNVLPMAMAAECARDGANLRTVSGQTVCEISSRTVMANN